MNSIRKMVKGFTLIELLIVIAIIGILAVAFLPALTAGPAKARDAARKAAVGDIVSALESIVADGDTRPAGAVASPFSDGDPGDTFCLDWNAGEGTGALLDNGAVAISKETKKIPKDSSDSTDGSLCSTDGEEYFYRQLSEDGTYLVAVQVELLASANVDDTIVGADIRGYSNGDTALAATDGSTEDTAAPYFYMVVK